jgi:hypothetical protein
MKRIGTLLGLLGLLLAAWGCTFGHTEYPREQAIRDAWQTLQPSYAGSPYVLGSEPTLSSPYAAGVLDPGFLTDAVNMVSFVRFLEGVPQDIVLDVYLTAWAQAGAMLMAVNQSTDRSQTAPGDMGLTLASLALSSVKYALIGSGTDLAASAATAVRDWVRGGADLSTDQAASRRWILNPALYELGVGFADSPLPTPTFYASLEVRNNSRPSIPSWDYVAWPNGDSFPVEFFGPGDPWTITLNPAEYQVPAGYQIVVTLSRYFVGPTWTLTYEDTSPAGEYLTVSTDLYGVASCIIFRPGPSVVYSAGDWFNVQVTGLHPLYDAPAELSFNVRFFSLD